jgi:glucokinase
MGTRPGVLAVDLGGTNLRVAAISPGGEMLLRESAPTRAEEGHDSVIARMAELCQTVAGKAGLASDAPIGVASPGPLNPHTGVVIFTPNLPGWRDVPLGPSLSERTGRPVRVSNDANCAALGEARFGAATGLRDVVYIGLGTGVGGGLVIGGKMYEGGFGMGVELGHVTVATDGPRCTCGSIGCLESFVAGWAIAREAQLVCTTADGDRIRSLANGGKADARAVTLAASEGDPAAIEILARAGRALGAAMGAFINIFNPEAIVIGGGLSVSGEALLKPARAAMASYSFQGLRVQASIRLATLGDDNGLYGAGALALELASA